MMQNMYTAMGISPEVYEYGEQTPCFFKRPI